MTPGGVQTTPWFIFSTVCWGNEVEVCMGSLPQKAIQFVFYVENAFNVVVDGLVCLQ